MNKLKKKLEELEELEKIAQKADAAYDADPENVEKEKAADRAYGAEFETFMAAADLIVLLTDGRIDAKTAREMVRARRDDILALVV